MLCRSRAFRAKVRAVRVTIHASLLRRHQNRIHNHNLYPSRHNRVTSLSHSQKCRNLNYPKGLVFGEPHEASVSLGDQQGWCQSSMQHCNMERIAVQFLPRYPFVGEAENYRSVRAQHLSISE